nr:hypothetical protein [Tanacetum cinerariifolium]
RHEEQIEDILNHLDELSLDYIEEMEGHVNGRVIIEQYFDKLKDQTLRSSFSDCWTSKKANET